MSGGVWVPLRHIDAEFSDEPGAFVDDRRDTNKGPTLFIGVDGLGVFIECERWQAARWLRRLADRIEKEAGR